MADMSGWANLGDALAGDSELEYQKGLQLGANTENALAQARARVTKAKAQLELADQLKAVGVNEARANAAQGFAQAELDPSKVGDIIAKQQEYDFRQDAAGLTGLDIATGNRRLMGVASGPVDIYQRLGGAVDNRFDMAGPQETPGVGSDGGGRSAFTQSATLFDLIDPKTGKIREGVDPTTGKTYREVAYAVLRNSERGAEAGGVPVSVDTNVFSPGRGTATPVVSAQTVADNATAIESTKKLPALYARFRNQTAQADTVIADVDDALKDLSWLSTGLAAQVSRGVAGTPAFNLDKAVDSIKANVGFQGLQQMRYESPTGGALGNTAVEELKFLQSALGSLDTAQNQDQLAKALTKVRQHYVRFKDYAAQDYEIALERSQRGTAPSAAAPPPREVQAPAAPAPAAQPVEARVTNDAEYDALPSGTLFVGPDGKRRRKP